MKHIVIVGGGFAGVSAGLSLLKHFKPHEVKITLVDRNPYHLFTPSLYELASSEEPQKNITIPLDVIFRKRIHIVRDMVETIHAESQSITLRENGKMAFDYLIIALGSEPAYYGIPGLKEHSVAFKKLRDAVKIKEQIKTLCCKDGLCERKVQVVIGGGGFAGTELAEELMSYKDKIAKQNGLDKNCLQMTIIQGSDRLLKELDPHVSAIATKRLMTPSVQLAFGGHITKVDEKQVYTDDGKTYPYEILIWTGGVEANHLLADSGLPVTKRGSVIVNDFLQVPGFPTIFAVGDVAGYIDPKTNEPVPNVVEVAEAQGKTAALNIYHLFHEKTLHPYHYSHLGYVVPLRGRFAAAELMGNLHFDGFPGWVLQQLILLRYLLGILPWWGAFKRWNTFELALEQ